MSEKNRKLLVTAMVIAMLVILPLISFFFLRSGKSMWSDRSIPAYALTNQLGEAFGTEQLQGKVYVAAFLYSTCDDPYCDSVVVTQQLVQEQFADNTDLIQLTFSIDPEVDSVPVLQDWATEMGATPGFWYLLTGDKATVAKVVVGGYRITKLRFREPRFSGLKASPRITIIGKDGFIKGYYKTETARHRERLMRAIQTELDS